jgi:excinuclease ABC subunit C
MNDRLPFLREKTARLTSSPGVYRMRDKNNHIIYIGKAKNLKKRVFSYFRENADHLPKVAKMVSLVFDYDFIVTETEIEALTLECSQIKEYAPKYNIKLRDDKGYSWIKITEGDYPVLFAELQKSEGGTHLGPFMSYYTAHQTAEDANRVFMLPTCKRKFPDDFGKARPCLSYHIGLCFGLCKGGVSKEEYADIFAEALRYIKDGSEAGVARLTEMMNSAAENLDFERAAVCRNRINAIKKAAERQLVIADGMKDTDVLALSFVGSDVCAAVLSYRNGRLSDRGEFFLGEAMNPSDMYEDFILQYYTDNNTVPREIITAEDLPNTELLEELLREKSGHSVDLSNKKRGKGLKLIELAKANASESLALRLGRTGREVNALEELGKLLGLPAAPRIIESYDISNLGSDSIVAGMVVFENGRPNKKYYKKFSIKSTEIQNDYASMAEVLRRRFSHFLDENETDEGFLRKPDLILLDGGKGQVNAAKPVMENLGLSHIPLFGMVKDNRHRTRAIAESGGEIAISGSKSAFYLVTQIQDEVHRFSVTYQRKKHKATSLETGLTSIKGIGEKKAAKLFTAVKSKEELQKLTADEIAKIMGVNAEIAENVLDYLHK